MASTAHVGTVCRSLAALALLAGVARGENLIPNPGFEQIDPDTRYPRYWGRHWVYKGLYTVKQDAAFARRGSVCMGVHQSGPEAHKAYTGLPGKRLRVGARRDLHASVWAKGKGSLAFCAYLNGAPGFLGSISSPWMDVASDEWKELTWDFVVPKSRDKKGKAWPVDEMSLNFHVKGGPVWIDDAGLYRQGTQPARAAPVGDFDPTRVPLATLPKLQRPPTIDGKLAKGEWDGAAAFTGLHILGGGLSPRQTHLFAAFDEAHVYIAFRGLHEGTFRTDKALGRDKGFSSHAESVEIWLEPPGTGWFQIIGFPSGTLMDQSEKGGFAWNPPGVRYKCTVEDSGETVAGILTFGKKLWTAELAIPFADLGVAAPKDGETWRANLCRDFSVPPGTQRGPADWTTWSPIKGAFSSARQFGYATFHRAAPALQTASLGDLQNGHLAVTGSVRAAAQAEVAVQAAVLLDAAGEKEVLTQSADIVLKPGATAEFVLDDTIKVSGTTRLKLRLVAKDVSSGRRLAQQELPFTCLTSFRLALRPILVSDFIDVALDAARVPDLPEAFHATVCLERAGTKAAVRRAQARLTAQALAATLRLDIAGVKPGNYVVVGQLKTAQGKVLASSAEPFPLPTRPAWLGNTLGVTDGAPPPWTPIEVDGRTVRVTQREYLLADSGLPAQITTLGKQVMTRPAALTAIVNGKPVAWTFQPLEKTAQKPGWATWRIRGSGGPLELTGSLRFEFDGFARWSVTLAPQQPVTLDALALEFPLRNAFTLHARAAGPKGHRSASLFREPGDNPPPLIQVGTKGSWDYSPAGWRWPGEFLNWLFVGDDTSGFAVMCETDEHVHGPRHIELVRRGAERMLRVNLVSTPTRLDGPVPYDYAYQAAPTRPEPKDPKVWHAAYGGTIAAHIKQGHQPFLARVHALCRYWQMKWICYPQVNNPQAWAHDQRLLEPFGCRPVPNYHYNAIAQESPVFPHFHYEWEVVPRGGWSTLRGSAKVTCLRSSWQDFVLHTVKTFVDDFGYHGIYTDSGPSRCLNAYHGCGYVRNGERRPTLNLWATRETLKRLHTMLKSGGRDGIIFSHTTQAPCVVGFVDVVTQGEEWGTAHERQYRQLTPDMFRSREARVQYGTPFTWYVFHQYSWRGKRYGGPVPFHEVMGMSLLHRTLPTVGDGTGVVEIVRYWDLLDPWWTTSEFLAYYAPDAPARTDKADVLASTFLKRAEGKALVVVYNWAYEPREFTLTLDWRRLGLAGEGVRITDAFSHEVVGQGRTPIRLKLPARDLRILLVAG